jgi:hypothetical protein
MLIEKIERQIQIKKVVFVRVMVVIIAVDYSARLNQR